MRRLSLDPFGHVTLSREGERLVADSHVKPFFPRPPLHVHARQSERFEVARGQLRLTVNRAELQLGPGDAVTVPAGTPHTFAVEGANPVALKATFEPAGRLEEFFEGLYRLVRDGHIDAAGRPRSRAVAPWALQHLDDFRLARVPARLQRAALAAIAGLPGAGFEREPTASSCAPP